MHLRQLAHIRTGDKGDVSQVSVIAYDLQDYGKLEYAITVDRIISHLPRLSYSNITRYDLPAIGALNFVIEGALAGGVTRSMSLDAHGKTLGAQLLDIDIPEEVSFDTASGVFRG